MADAPKTYEKRLPAQPEGVFFVDQARELLLLDVAEAAPLDNEREPSVGTAGDKARLGEGDGLPVADALAREQDFAPLACE